jgi:putative ABC transport system permease protein
MKRPKEDRNRPSPPRAALWIIRKTLFFYTAVSLPGDLEEEFHRIGEAEGYRQARHWYRRQVVESLPFLVKSFIYWNFQMFKSNMKIALRNIRRQKAHSFINITGLAVGIACSLLIFLWVRDELGVNGFHKNGSDIYRVVQDIRFSGREMSVAVTQGPLGPSLRDSVPEIVDSVRLGRVDMKLRGRGKPFDETLGMADGSLFTMFSFPLVKGDPAAVLAEPRSIVLSEDMARKYFPGEDPVGRTIQARDSIDFRVTGVMKNIPGNSSLRFDFLIPFVFGRELGLPVDQWDDSRFTTFVRLRKGVSAEMVVAKIADHLKGKPTIEQGGRLNLQPLSRIYLFPGMEGEPFLQGDIRNVRIFALAALFILMIACVNFMNLTTARSANRAREVGMRKVFGARRSQLISQFYSECLILTGVAFLLAVLGAGFLLRPFNALAAKELSLGLFADPRTLVGLGGLILLTGLLAGSYPALFLSKFRPVRVLRGTLSAGSRGQTFRKVLVMFQFAVTSLLLICTLFIRDQLNFMRNYNTGYDKDQVLTVRMSDEIRPKYEAVRAEILRDPDILGVTASSSIPTRGYLYSNTLWKWAGQNPREEILIRGTCADVGFFDLLGIKILQGRDFLQTKNLADTQWIINEEAARVMGFKDPLGQSLSQADVSGTIVGVVKNYNFTVLRKKIDPLIIGYFPPLNLNLLARIRPGKAAEALVRIEEIWKKFAPQDEFRFTFLDEAVDALYRSEERIGAILRYFSLLAVLVACLGLFGLASFMAEQRTKEIGIRKVLGASTAKVVYLFSREFALWVIAANAIAWPLAYYFVQKWLRGYAYRIAMGPGPYLFAAALALLVALGTVSYHLVRAARENPAQSLKFE